MKKDKLVEDVKNNFQSKSKKHEPTAQEIREKFRSAVADFLSGKIDNSEFESISCEIDTMRQNKKNEIDSVDAFTEDLIHRASDFLYYGDENEKEFRKELQEYLSYTITDLT